MQNCCAAYALAAAQACDLHAELGRRAKKLLATVPQLRAKGADAIVETLLAEDAVAPSGSAGAMSAPTRRRLFDRLALYLSAR